MISVATPTLYGAPSLGSRVSLGFLRPQSEENLLVMLGELHVSRSLPPSSKRFGVTLYSDEVPEFIDQLPHCLAGICLADVNDPRHQFVVGFRERSGHMLHEAVHSLKNNGAEDSIDCVKMIISSIRVLELDYPCDHLHYSAVKKSYEFALQISRSTKNQKAFPRYVVLRPSCILSLIHRTLLF